MLEERLPSKPGLVRLVLLDPHPVARIGLATVIHSKTRTRVIEEFSLAGDLLAAIENLQPDVLVMEVCLHDVHGLDVIRIVHRRSPQVKIVVYSKMDEQLYARHALDAGASGYVMKSEPSECVIDAIQTAMKGDRYLSRRMASRIINSRLAKHSHHLSAVADDLTDREALIMNRLGSGTSTEAIARSMDLNRKAVEKIRDRLKDKFGLDNNNQLKAFALHWLSSQTSSRDPEKLLEKYDGDVVPG